MRVLQILFLVVLYNGQDIDCENVIYGKLPKLMPNANFDYVIPERSSVKLMCPIDANSNQGDFVAVQWFKNTNERLSEEESYYRYNMNGNYLKIDSLNEYDAGLYTCIVNNGFGTRTANITLKVISSFVKTSSPNVPIQNRVNELRAPKFMQITQYLNSLERIKGDQAQLNCEVRNPAKSDIIWFKNGKVLNEEDYGITRSKWVLDLKDLRIGDTGNYTCKVFNKYGQINATYELRVYEDLEIFEGAEPKNTTIPIGTNAVFVCKIKSSIVPRIQWLKQISSHEYETYVLDKHIMLPSTNDNSFQMKDGMHYITISQSEHMTQTTAYNIDENTFTSKLTIKNTRVNDTGIYLCFGVNQNGYSYRKAHLAIDHLGTFSDHSLVNEFKLAIMILVPVLLLAIVISLTVFSFKRNDCLSKYFAKLKSAFKCRKGQLSNVDTNTNTISVSCASTESTYCNDYLMPESHADDKSDIYYKIIDPSSSSNPNQSFLSKCSGTPSSVSRFYYQVNNSSMDFNHVLANNHRIV